MNALDITQIINALGFAIYVAIALLAVWGMYNAILLYRTLRRKSIAEAQALELVGKVGEKLRTAPRVEDALEPCSAPAVARTAFAQLISAALRAREKGLARVKQLLVMDFHTEILSPMESRLASISTAAKMGPLLGLLGTVLSMIESFGRMGRGQRADPSALADAIGLGLWTTAAGLILATPFMVLANDLQSRIRRLRDQTERNLQSFLETFERDDPVLRAQKPQPGSRSGTMKATLPR